MSTDLFSYCMFESLNTINISALYYHHDEISDEYENKNGIFTMSDGKS
jgi:hypothetical protein